MLHLVGRALPLKNARPPQLTDLSQCTVAAVFQYLGLEMPIELDKVHKRPRPLISAGCDPSKAASDFKGRLPRPRGRKYDDWHFWIDPLMEHIRSDIDSADQLVFQDPPAAAARFSPRKFRLAQHQCLPIAAPTTRAAPLRIRPAPKPLCSAKCTTKPGCQFAMGKDNPKFANLLRQPHEATAPSPRALVIRRPYALIPCAPSGRGPRLPINRSISLHPSSPPITLAIHSLLALAPPTPREPEWRRIPIHTGKSHERHHQL